MTANYSIVIPARNEAKSLESLLPQLIALNPSEIILVDDGSTDSTADICTQLGVKRVHHTHSLGNGAAIKAGARAARSEVIVFMDADGQHRVEDIPQLLEKYAQGYDLVVGARSGSSHAGSARKIGNRFYNWFASKITGRDIADLTSGFRVVTKAKFLEFLYLLPNGFSYPTTSTMAFCRTGYQVGYMPVEMPERVGTSHLRIWKDGVRFLVIILKVGTLYSPLKIFFPIAFAHFLLGLAYYAYTFLTETRFTNMSALLFTTAITIFLIGLVAEQITTLIYKKDYFAADE